MKTINFGKPVFHHRIMEL